MHKHMVAALGAAVLLAAPGTGAQVFTPTFQAPVPGNDLGIYLVDANNGDVGVEGILRRRIGATSDLGLRVGFTESGAENVLLLGADLRSPLRLAGAAPVALAFTAGVQAALLEGDAFGVQGGLSIGYPFRDAQLRFTPYIHPRLALVSANDDSELDLEADLGFDFGLTPDLDLRIGANLGDGADWGIGLAFRR